MRELTVLAGLFILVLAVSCSGPQGGAMLGNQAAPDNGADEPVIVSEDWPIVIDKRAFTAPVEGRWIIVLKPEATDADRDALMAGLEKAPTHSYGTVYKGFAGEIGDDEIAELMTNPLVAIIEQDSECFIDIDPVYEAVPSDELEIPYDSTPFIPVVADDEPDAVVPYSGTNPMGWGVNRVDADLNDVNGDGGAGGGAGEGVGCAVLDTGVNFSHPDLKNADGSNAIIAEYNAIYPTRSAEDGYGHGTHVAGIIAARDDSVGYVGVAPLANIISVKVLGDRGSGYTSWINGGIDWCAANKATYNILVANMSLSGGGPSPSQYAAIEAAKNTGITFVVSAGNNYRNAANYHPAGFDNVITVSALTNGDYFAYYSNYGDVVDIIAPGTAIPSAWKNERYITISDTSMSAPHVAGGAALWLDNNAVPSNGTAFTMVMNALLTTGESGTWGPDPAYGTPHPNPRSPHEPLLDCETL